MSEPSYKELKKAFPDGSMIRFKERRNKNQAEKWLEELGVTQSEHKCRSCSKTYKSINPTPSDKLCFDCWLDLPDSEVI
mgnify:CR=1 FL=1